MLKTSYRVAAFAMLAAFLLSACVEQVPGLGPDPRSVARENEAKAIGGACRYAMRGLEDCYALNPKASKNAIYLGWKDMDEYMREHKLEGAPSVLTQMPPNTTKKRNMSAETEYPVSTSVSSTRSRN